MSGDQLFNLKGRINVWEICVSNKCLLLILGLGDCSSEGKLYYLKYETYFTYINKCNMMLYDD